MRQKVREKMYDLYGGFIPGYIKDAGLSFVSIHYEGIRGEKKTVKITIPDIAEYYASEACNIVSGCRTLAGITGDWRLIDGLARECLGWFKAVHVMGMRKAARKRGLEPKF